MSPRLRETSVEIEVPFHDLDPTGYVWHGNFAKYLELARCELLKQLGYNYDVMMESGYMWPIIDMRLRYVKPLRFMELMTVRATSRVTRISAGPRS